MAKPSRRLQNHSEQKKKEYRAPDRFSLYPCRNYDIILLGKSPQGSAEKPGYPGFQAIRTPGCSAALAVFRITMNRCAVPEDIMAPDDTMHLTHDIRQHTLKPLFRDEIMLC